MNQIAVVEADAVVATMSRARLALAEAKTIQETKRIVDAAAAAEIYARRQKLGEETEDLAAAIKVEALRKLGEMLAATPRNDGVKKAGTILGGSKMELPRNDAPTLAELGLTKKESAVAQKLAALPEKEFQQVRDGHLTVAKAIAAVDASKPAKTPVAKAAEPEREAHPEDLSLEELVDELQAENTRLTGEITALAADDQKAETLKWRRAYDHAQREQSAAMDKAHKLEKHLTWTTRQLMRCGKAVGVEDPAKVAATVEALARDQRKAA